MKNYSSYTPVSGDGLPASYESASASSNQPTFQSRSIPGSGSVTQGAIFGSPTGSSGGYMQGGSYTVGSAVNQVVSGQAMHAVAGSPTGYAQGYAMATSPVPPLPRISLNLSLPPRPSLPLSLLTFHDTPRGDVRPSSQPRSS